MVFSIQKTGFLITQSLIKFLHVKLSRIRYIIKRTLQAFKDIMRVYPNATKHVYKAKGSIFFPSRVGIWDLHDCTTVLYHSSCHVRFRFDG